jgi:hypothetical protein
MNLKEIMKFISIPDVVRDMVAEYLKNTNFDSLKDELNLLTNKDTAKEAYGRIVEHIGVDDKGTKMLALNLYATTLSLNKYLNLGISEDVFIDTMKCYSRFINEHYNSYGNYGFDRAWWVYRQLSLTIFRLGELEYEMTIDKEEKVISIHIPSDAKLDVDKIKESIILSKAFFMKYFPEYMNVKYICRSWLLSSDLKNVLDKDSKIIKFQKFFDIIEEEKNHNSFMLWIFKKHYTDYRFLPEETSLQKNVKKYLLDGNGISLAYGVLKDKFNKG